MSDPRHDFGLAGESAAASALEAAGLTVLERRFRCRLGEIDLVARDGETIVFVEVKARAGDGFGAPGEAVHAGKRARLARVAAAWLQHRRAQEPPCRFDVVEVVRTPGGALRTRHLPDAFRLWPTG
jgi:putative endonuclease